MDAAQSIDDQVKSCVAEFVCKKPGDIHDESTLLGDLGLDGDDADEFLSDFAKRFEVDMVGFRFEDHFSNEGMYPWQFRGFVWNLIQGMLGKDPHALAGLKAIKVEDLIHAANSHRWNLR